MLKADSTPVGIERIKIYNCAAVVYLVVELFLYGCVFLGGDRNNGNYDSICISKGGYILEMKLNALLVK